MTLSSLYVFTAIHHCPLRLTLIVVLTSKNLPTLLIANINAIFDKWQTAYDRCHGFDLATQTSVNKMQDQKRQFQCIMFIEIKFKTYALNVTLSK